MSRYLTEDIDPDELARRKEIADEIAGAVRGLVGDTVRTEVDAAAAAEAIAHIEAARTILKSARIEEEAFGVRFNADGRKRTWGNAVLGARNPVAPPVVIGFDGELAWAELELGAQYEGPAGLVHGGILAAILDQMLGSATEHAGTPGMTGTLTIRYRRATPLGAIRAEARRERIDGVKSIASGRIYSNGEVTAEAEGIFILPRWARSAAADEVARKSVGDG
ncbi:MAG: PaaI family thioesterase [Gordonia sp. (in: high G+C Gram-positive bacteria)]